MKKLFLTLLFLFAVLLSYGQIDSVAFAKKQSKTLQSECKSTFKYFSNHPKAVTTKLYRDKKGFLHKISDAKMSACDSCIVLIKHNPWIQSLEPLDRNFRIVRVQYYQKLAVKSTVCRRYLLTYTLRACTYK